MKNPLRVLLALELGLLPTVCLARDYRVPSAGRSSSIQAAVNRCRTGDRILLDRGVYRQHVSINKPLTIIGKGPGSTILDGGGTGPVLQVICRGKVRMVGLTIRNGVIVAPPDQPARGGGIRNDAASLNLEAVCIESNEVWGGVRQSLAGGEACGGGLFSRGPLVLQNCRFTANGAYGGCGTTSSTAYAAGRACGGGVYAASGLRMDQCVLSDNECIGGYFYYDGSDSSHREVSAGAGCFAQSNSAHIAATRFENNSCGDPTWDPNLMWWWDSYTDSRRDQGAGYAQQGGQGRLIDCIFQDNSAASGGALHNSGTVFLHRCILLRNLARRGGAVNNQGWLSVSNSTIEDNAALYGGGVNNSGVLHLATCEVSYNYGSFETVSWKPVSIGGGVWNVGTVTVTDCSFDCNSAERGGGFWNQWALDIRDSTFTGNHADYGGGLYNQGRLVLADSRFSGDYCLSRSKGPGYTHGSSWQTDGCGGAIFNSATATVRRCFFDGNFVVGASGWAGRAGGYGGAILNNGWMMMDQSSLVSNRATAEVGSYRAADIGGGSVCNQGSLVVSNTSFIANSGQNRNYGAGGGGAADGGALYNAGTAAVYHCTFVSNYIVSVNSAQAFGASISAVGPVTIGNTMVDDWVTSPVRGCWGDFISSGRNLFEDASAMNFRVAQSSDLLNVKAQLGPVVEIYHGHKGCLLLSDSPAIDGGSRAGAGRDQRGAGRPRDQARYPNAADGSDIGALEMCGIDIVLKLEYKAAGSTSGRPQYRLTLVNAGLRTARQVMIAVMLPAYCSLASVDGARTINAHGRLVLLQAQPPSPNAAVDVCLVLKALRPPAGELSAKAFCTPSDEFMANNTMSVLSP